MLIYSCIIYALLWYSRLHSRFATCTRSLCGARLINLLVETHRDALVQPHYTVTVGPAAQRNADIQLRYICCRFAVHYQHTAVSVVDSFATYTLSLYFARLITPLVERQRGVYIQLRHICFAPLLVAVCSRCNVYAFALLRAAGQPSVQAQRHADIQLIHMFLGCHDLYTAVSVVSSLCNVYPFALLWAAEHLSGRPTPC